MTKPDVDQIISQCRGAFISILLHQSEANALIFMLPLLQNSPCNSIQCMYNRVIGSANTAPRDQGPRKVK